MNSLQLLQNLHSEYTCRRTEIPRGCTDFFFCDDITREPLDGKTWFQDHTVELLNVVESWESVQGNLRYPLFARGTFRAFADSMHKNVHREAHGCLRVIEREREESRRVALSSGLCLKSYK